MDGKQQENGAPDKEKKGREVNLVMRGALIGAVMTELATKGLPNFSEVGRRFGYDRDTVRHLYNHAKKNVSDPNDVRQMLSVENVKPSKRSGAPKALSDADVDRLIAHAMLNQEQRGKLWMRIAEECELAHVSRATIYKEFHERGYGRLKNLTTVRI